MIKQSYAACDPNSREALPAKLLVVFLDAGQEQHQAGHDRLWVHKQSAAIVAENSLRVDEEFHSW